MSFLTSVFVYILIWWVMLFTILPLGVRRHEEEGKGYDAGAPAMANFKKKIIINTVLSAVILGLMHLTVYLGFDWDATFRNAIQ